MFGSPQQERNNTARLWPGFCPFEEMEARKTMPTTQIIEDHVWTIVEDTTVEVLYLGDSSAEIYRDAQGAIVLPEWDSSELTRLLWIVRPGDVPVTRGGQPFNLDDSGLWPAGFTLTDDGTWVEAKAG